MIVIESKTDLVEAIHAIINVLNDGASEYLGSDAFRYAELLRAVRNNIDYGSPKIIVKDETEY